MKRINFLGEEEVAIWSKGHFRAGEVADGVPHDRNPGVFWLTRDLAAFLARLEVVDEASKFLQRCGQSALTAFGTEEF